MDINGEKIIIYGAHLIAMEYYRHLKALGCGNMVIGFAVTSMCDNPSKLDDKPVRIIQEYTSYLRDATVVIAVPGKYHSEVRTLLSAIGFSQIISVTLEDMSRIKACRLIEKFGTISDIKLNISDNDPTWLNAYMNEEGGRLMCKYPTLFHLEEKEMIKNSDAIYLRYESEIKEIVHIKSMSSDECVSIDNIDSIVKIYMVFDKSVTEIIKNIKYDSWVKPILCGCMNKESERDYYYDNEWTHSLSDKNGFLAEMTGAYWIWKQAHGSEYKGLCHYRRHFIIGESDIRRMKASGVDVLLTVPRFVPGGVKSMFIAETPVKESVMNNLLSALDMVASEDRQEFEDYLDGDFYFPNNMVMAKSNIYDAYCEWIFPVLLRMLDVDLDTGYGHENDRHIAYAAELLTSYYFMKRKSKLKTAFTDYKFYE